LGEIYVYSKQGKLDDRLVNAVIAALHDDFPNTRAFAIITIEKIEPEYLQLTDALRQVAENDDDDIRGMAALALKRMDDRRQSAGPTVK
jgi:hypothetical protein